MNGQKIKSIREYLGMTQAELAREIGVTRLAVSHWEIGSRQPSVLATRAVEMLGKLRGPDKRIEMEKEAKERFDKINQQYFNNRLRKRYQIIFSKRMKKVLGRAFPKKKVILLSTAKLKESGWEEVEKTLKHEMIHCWLYERGRPWGHNREFKTKLREIATPGRGNNKGEKGGHLGLKG